MDREARDIFDLLDEIEKELGIATCPVNWPIGSGKNFKGVYDRNTKKVMLYSDTLKGTKEGEEKDFDINLCSLENYLNAQFDMEPDYDDYYDDYRDNKYVNDELEYIFRDGAM